MPAMDPGRALIIARRMRRGTLTVEMAQRIARELFFDVAPDDCTHTTTEHPRIDDAPDGSRCGIDACPVIVDPNTRAAS